MFEGIKFLILLKALVILFDKLSYVLYLLLFLIIETNHSQHEKFKNGNRNKNKCIFDKLGDN